MNTKIISDSSCDLSQEYIEKYNIEILPIQLATEDGEDLQISIDEMFHRQRQGQLFKTAQIGLYPYLQTFEKYGREGRDFIYLSLSSGLTGGFDNSLLALREVRKKYPQVSMASIDTKCASVGQGLFLYHMGRAAKKGKNFEELLDLADFLRDNMEHIFTVLDMEYLYQGGRVSRTKKNLSKMLNLIPIVKMDREGKLYLYDIVRGRNRANRRMIEIIEEDTSGRHLNRDVIMPVYGEKREDVQSFIKRLEEKEFLEILPMQIGTIIGTHVGPDIVGTSYLKKSLPEEFYE